MRLAPTEYAIPASPPADLLAELDTAAAVLDDLSARSVELILDMDGPRGRIRIELGDDHGTRRLTPSQLFELLTTPDL